MKKSNFVAMILEAGMNAHLAKPLQMEKLIETIVEFKS